MSKRKVVITGAPIIVNIWCRARGTLVLGVVDTPLIPHDVARFCLIFLQVL
ncbi:MAG: hypothetical protein QGI83_09640 [Candidatus Latescibacteria bacterium]|nr:hypothetical protein [Candidatus Latescibacterota bacterium]